MAVWDEEWEAREDSVWCPAKRTTVAFGPMAAEDAKLAAAAPKMARLLLELEWEGNAPYADDDACPSCGWPRGRTNEHHPKCAWLAVMRAAGVRD